MARLTHYANSFYPVAHRWGRGIVVPPMRTLLRLSTTLMLAVLPAVPISAQQAAPGFLPPQDASQQVRRLLEQRKAQTELPGKRQENRESSRSVASDPRRGTRQNQPRQQNQQDSLRLDGGVDLAVPLLLVALGVAAALLLVAILRGWRGRASERKATLARPKIHHATNPAPASAAPDDPDELAAAGNFAAALQALLYQCLQLLQQRIGRLPPHATARSSVQRARQQALPASHLDGVVRAHERVQFGGAMAARADYDAARGHFEAWRSACNTTP